MVVGTSYPAATNSIGKRDSRQLQSVFSQWARDSVAFIGEETLNTDAEGSDVLSQLAEATFKHQVAEAASPELQAMSCAMRQFDYLCSHALRAAAKGATDSAVHQAPTAPFVFLAHLLMTAIGFWQKRQKPGEAESADSPGEEDRLHLRSFLDTFSRVDPTFRVLLEVAEAACATFEESSRDLATAAAAWATRFVLLERI